MSTPIKKQFQLPIIVGPLQAPIYFIHDLHNAEDIFTAQKALLEKTARNGDVILLEGAQRFVMLNPKCISLTKHLEQEVWVMGWDNLHAMIEANKMTKELVDLIESFENPDFDFLTREVKTRRMKKLSQEIDQCDLVIRNASLMETLKIVRPLVPDTRIFVVAGKSHLTPEFLKQMKKGDYCSITFKETGEMDHEEGREHLETILSQTCASSLKIDHLIDFYPSGPCTLLHPVRSKERFDRSLPNKIQSNSKRLLAAALVGGLSMIAVALSLCMRTES